MYLLSLGEMMVETVVIDFRNLGVLDYRISVFLGKVLGYLKFWGGFQNVSKHLLVSTLLLPLQNSALPPRGPSS